MRRVFRSAVPVLLLLSAAALFAAEPRLVLISEPELLPVSAEALTGDGGTFYALAGRQMTRTSRDGTLLDPAPIGMDTGSSLTAGAGVLVALVSDGSGATQTLKAFTPDGEELWSRGGQLPGALFFDGTAFEHVWSVWNQGTWVTRFDASGSSVTTRQVRTGKGPVRLLAARSSRGYVFAWYDDRGLVAQFFDDDGTISPIRRLGSGSIDPVAVATSGDDAVVLLRVSTGELQAVRFDRERLLGGPAAIASDVARESFAVLWDGRVYRVTWTRADGTFEARDVRTGLDFASRATFSWQDLGRVSCGKTKSAAAGGRVVLSACGLGVYLDAGQPVASARPPVPVALAAARIHDSAVAWTGDRYVVVWQQATSSAVREIFARFIAIDGTPLSDPFLVTSATTWGGARVAALPDTILVAWTSNESHNWAKGRRFDVEGHAIDDVPFEFTGLYDLQLAANGREFTFASAHGCVLDIQHLSARGALAGLYAPPAASLRLCSRDERSLALSLERIEWDGERYVVLYNERRYTGMEWFNDTPFLVRVSRDGIATPPLQLEEEPFGAYVLAVADDAYLTFAAGIPVRVPRDLRSLGALNDWSGNENPEVLWTGNAYLLFDSRRFDLFARDGHALGGGILYRPPGCYEPPAPVPAEITGAGNRCGGALLTYTLGPGGALVGRVLPCAAPKQRPVRK